MNKEQRLKDRIRKSQDKTERLYDELQALNPEVYATRFDYPTSKITLMDILA